LFVPFRIAKQMQTGQLASESAARNIVRTNEVGAADWLSLRPVIPPGGRALDGPHPWVGFFWECKAPGKKPSAAQLAWLDKRRQVGLETAWFHEFEGRDRQSPACEPRDSHVFLEWFCEYFTTKETGRAT
jgi:hypothetical protein